MADPIIVLAPPRSFTSIVGAMLGQHPELYGFPELNLFVAETMQERSSMISKLPLLEHGLLRAVAEVFTQEQTEQAMVLAQHWLDTRTHSSCSAVFQELADRVSPRTTVDKSPLTVLHLENLHRIRRDFPEARFVHLLRHPRSQGESLWRLAGPLAGLRLDAIDYTTDPPSLDVQIAWYRLHVNILTFLEAVPDEQQLRVCGEDLLADPDPYLREMMDWFGLRTDDEAIEAMKHPERSPYAGFGPPNALFGNDPQFLRSPALRNGSTGEKAKEMPRLDGPLPWRRDGGGFLPAVQQLARDFGYE